MMLYNAIPEIANKLGITYDAVFVLSVFSIAIFLGLAVLCGVFLGRLISWLLRFLRKKP